MEDRVTAEHEPIGPAEFIAERDKQAVVRLPVDSLLAADSPRLAGEDLAHARTLAETAADLPPIIVHRPTMRVIDGMHRLRAAQMNGADTISVQFFDGDLDAAFVLSVEANVTHGLPLTLADRRAAARRIIAAHPHWSDRAVAAITGLAHKTVGAVRRRSAGDVPQATARIGRDGRVRPVDSLDRRRHAGELLRQNPDAPLREVARTAGISHTTVKDVRKRLRRGDDPVPAAVDYAAQRVRPVDPAAVLHRLRLDPSLRFTESGRALLRWLGANPDTPAECDQLADSVPDHCAVMVTELARRCADSWLRLAERLEQRTRKPR